MDLVVTVAINNSASDNDQIIQQLSSAAFTLFDEFESSL
jgi:hypothetical protein